jgi:hypothetical protein
MKFMVKSDVKGFAFSYPYLWLNIIFCESCEAFCDLQDQLKTKEKKQKGKLRETNPPGHTSEHAMEKGGLYFGQTEKRTV